MERLRSVREKIAAAARRSGRDPSAIQVLGASKLVSVERIRLAVSAGLEHLGENRVQEAGGKIDELDDLEPPPTWHLIGHLQSNKARHAVRMFDWIHSVDSFSLAVELDRRAAGRDAPLNVLLEVNTTGEAAKFGVNPSQLLETVEQIGRLPHLRVRGLMTLGRLSSDPEDARPAFRSLAELLEQAREKFPELPLEHLSMGMSGDYEVAVEEGATWVRIGTGLFGARPGI